MGYIEETGAAQHYRDVRIAAIYEGTNGIQAMDLVGRKLPMRGGGVVADQIAAIEATVAELDGDLADLGEPLADGVAALREATDWLLTNGLADPQHAMAGASPYLRLFGTVLGGWFLARQALAARGFDDDYSDRQGRHRPLLPPRRCCRRPVACCRPSPPAPRSSSPSPPNSSRAPDRGVGGGSPGGDPRAHRRRRRHPLVVRSRGAGGGRPRPCSASGPWPARSWWRW